MNQKSDQATTRAANRRHALNAIRQMGPLSRSQLAEVTGLSGAAITFVTTDLLEERLLVEREVLDASPKGGRKPVLLDVNYNGHYTIGVNLTEANLEVVLTDLQTTVLDHEFLPLPDHAPDPTLNAITTAVNTILERRGIKRSAVNGLGLAMGGVIDSERGMCVHSTILGWHNVAVAERLERATGIRVWVDNDINAFANAERLFGAGRTAKTFLAVTVGRGIGAALVVDGRVRQGRHSGVGSFGHTIVEPHGRLCECGRRGCLEAYSSEPALVARFNETSPRPVTDIAELLERLHDGDELALGLLEDAAVRVGRSIAAVVNLLDPELVVLGGEGLRLGSSFVQTLTRAVRENAYAQLADTMPIQPVLETLHSRTPWARGASSLASQHAFDQGALPSREPMSIRSTR